MTFIIFFQEAATAGFIKYSMASPLLSPIISDSGLPSLANQNHQWSAILWQQSNIKTGCSELLLNRTELFYATINLFVMMYGVMNISNRNISFHAVYYEQEPKDVEKFGVQGSTFKMREILLNFALATMRIQWYSHLQWYSNLHLLLICSMLSQICWYAPYYHRSLLGLMHK